MNGAYEELQTGQVGAETALLTYEAVAAVVRLGRFPPPEGSSSWDVDSVQGVAHDFMASRGTDRLRKLMFKATDQASFERLLEVSIRNHLRDDARRTARGRISRSITYRLSDAEGVERIGGEGSDALWMIKGGNRGGVPPSVDDMVASAYRIEGITTARAIETSQRGRALIDPSSLDAILLATLTLASCPVVHASLLDVIFARFPLVAEVSEVPYDGQDPPSADSVHVGGSGYREADEIWAQLVHRERLVLPAVGGSQSLRELASTTGMSKSTVSRSVERVRYALEVALPSADDPDAVASELLRRSATLRGGTERLPSPSSSETGGES